MNWKKNIREALQVWISWFLFCAENLFFCSCLERWEKSVLMLKPHTHKRNISIAEKCVTFACSLMITPKTNQVLGCSRARVKDLVGSTGRNGKFINMFSWVYNQANSRDIEYWISFFFLYILYEYCSTHLCLCSCCYLIHREQLASQRFPKVELLTQATFGKESAQEGMGSIGARANHGTSVGPSG